MQKAKFDLTIALPQKKDEIKRYHVPAHILSHINLELQSPTVLSNLYSPKSAQLKQCSGSSIPNGIIFEEQKKVEIIAIENKTKSCIIKHNGLFRNYWDFAMGIVLIYISISLPFTMAYIPNPGVGLRWIEQLTDYYFYLDIPINFLTTYEDESGQIIDNHCQITKHYLKGWFWIDIASVIPIDYFVGNTLSQMSKLSKVLRMLKLLRMLRLSKMGQLIPRLQAEYDIKNSYLTVSKFGIGIMFFSHWAGCFFYILARWQEFPSDSWVFLRELNSLPLYNRSIDILYVNCFYWSTTIMTTVGFGDVIPGTDIERCYVSVIMFFGACIFAYAISQLCVVIINLDKLGNLFSNFQDTSTSFFEKQKMPSSIPKQSKTYLFYKFYHSTVDMFDCMKHLEVCSENLQARFYKEHCLKMFHNVDVVTKYGDFFVYRIARLLKGNVYPPHATIMLETFQNNIFLIASGKVEIVLKIDLVQKTRGSSRDIVVRSRISRANLLEISKLPSRTSLSIKPKSKQDFVGFNATTPIKSTTRIRCGKSASPHRLKRIAKSMSSNQTKSMKTLSQSPKRSIILETKRSSSQPSLSQSKSKVEFVDNPISPRKKIVPRSPSIASPKRIIQKSINRALSPRPQRCSSPLEEAEELKNITIEAINIILPERSTFNEASSLLQKKSILNAFAHSFCDVYNIDSDDYLSILKEYFPVEHDKLFEELHKTYEKHSDFKDYILAKDLIEKIPIEKYFIYHLGNTKTKKLVDLVRVCRRKRQDKKNKENQEGTIYLKKKNKSQSNSIVPQSELIEMKDYIGCTYLQLDTLQHNFMNNQSRTLLKQAISSKYNLDL